MYIRRALLVAALAARFAGNARADAPVASESMADHRLDEVAEHQKVLFADAAAQGKGLDTSAFQTQLEQLTREYESLLRDNPKFAPGYACYGYMLWKVGLRKQAVAILLKANQLDPDIPLVKNELGNYLAEEGKPLEAVNYYLSAIKLAPDEPLYHYQLGTLLYEARDDFLKSGEWTRDSVDHAMQEAFMNASRLAPDRIEFAYRYAESYYDMRDPDWPTALKLWVALETKAPSDLERQTMRLHEANVLLNMGKADDARKIIDSITDASLEVQKQKLVARLAPDAGK